MRAGNNPEWILEGDLVVGLNLSADFCAEHEWGIDPLRRTLGIDGALRNMNDDCVSYAKPAGIERRRITRADLVKFYKGSGCSALLCDRWAIRDLDEYVKKNGVDANFIRQLPRDLRNGLGPLRAAWDGESFGIYGEAEHAARIEELWKSFQASNVAIWVSGRVMLFGNGGLVILHVDRIPQERLKELETSDKDKDQLRQESQKTGIRRRLEEAGKRFFSLSPAWLSEKRKSAWKVMYWLNPMDQDDNNYGWFTVEELEKWIVGSGPIPKRS